MAPITTRPFRTKIDSIRVRELPRGQEVLLYHVVRINTPFKVGVVVRLSMEMFDRMDELDTATTNIYMSYAVIMFLGLIWYTVFWPDMPAITSFFGGANGDHPLTKRASANWILFGATVFHATYAALFWYEAEESGLNEAISMWSTMISVLLGLTTCVNIVYYTKRA